jgi:hypothetical protein
MYSRISIFTFCLILAGCDLENLLHQPLSWVVIDERVITGKLNDIARRQNPYPESLQNVEALRERSSTLNRQISDLKRQVTDRCMKKKLPEKVSGSTPHSLPMHPKSPAAIYQRNCSSEANNDPLIMELSDKKSEISQLYKQKNVHDQKIRAAVKSELQCVIKERFQNEFDLVLTKRDNMVLYNQSSMIVDVTEKLIEHIRVSEIIIAIE